MCAQGINRRDFLRGAGILGAAAIGAGALAGCSSSAGAADEGATAEDFERQVSSEESCDVLVVGSGTAGTCASIVAAENGAQVICIEKNDALGGTSRFGEWIGGHDAKIQQEAGIEFNIKELVNNYEEKMDWGVPVDILEDFYVESGKTIDWLVEEGIPFQAGTGAAPHLVGIFDDEGNQTFLYEGMLKPLWEIGEGMPNVEFRTECPMVGLVTDNGKVTGAYAQDTEGNVIKINAGSVILATGGFVDDQELFWEAMHQDYSRYYNYGIPGRTGDGYRAMRELDAAVCGMPAMLAEPGVVGTTAFSDDPNIWFTWAVLPHINEKGKRFYDESVAITGNAEAMNNAALAQQKAFVLADYTYMAEGEIAKQWEMYSSGRGLEGVEEYEGVHKADTLEELADIIGVPADALIETVETYNAACESGVDEEFGCAPECLVPILKAPFYAAELQMAIYCTNGGARTNSDMQVLNQNGEVIEGLYAIGLDNGTIYKNMYPIGTFEAVAQTWAATGGRLAALSACGK